MEGGAANLLLHLLKIPATVTEEDLAHVLETLWSTRSTGLSSLQKRDLQSRLGLASTGELEPVISYRFSPSPPRRLTLASDITEAFSFRSYARSLPSPGVCWLYFSSLTN